MRKFRIDKKNNFDQFFPPPDEDASPLDKFKWETCALFVIYKRRQNLKQKELAEILGVDESRMSEMLHYKIERFTLDRLIGYAQIIHPNLKLSIKPS